MRNASLKVARIVCSALVSWLITNSAAVASMVTPYEAATNLDDIGLYRIGYALRGQDEHDFPTGWTGPSDEPTGVAYMPQGELDGKRALMLHPPWRTGPGIAFQEFTIKLPVCRRIILRGASAIRTEAVGKSDGVTFRVICDDRKLHEVHSESDLWQEFTLDLTAYAGKAVTLRFETDPGPDEDTTWDHALWGGRQLVLDGFDSGTDRRSPPPPLDLRRLQSKQNGSAVPLSGFDGRIETQVETDTAVFRYTGRDGTLEYRWRKPRAGGPFFGALELVAARPEAEVSVPVSSSATITWTAPAEFVSSRFLRNSGGVECIVDYKVAGELTIVRIAGRILGKSLVFDVSCDRPVVAALDAGGWNLVPIRKQVAVPYYSGQVFYLPAENLFVNTFLDWTSSNASSHQNTIAQYLPQTDGSRRMLKERAVFTAAWHLAEVLPNIPNPPSPHIKRVGGCVVLDVWGGRYVDIAARLKDYWDWGIRNCIVIIHAWQRSGYDNALPAHFPAMDSLGGDEGMKTLVATARRLGYLIALHENYMDYYPNYDFFDENDIALDSSGNRVLGWFNPGTRIQAFQIKPNAMLRLAATQSPEIHRRYGTNSSYLDVHSAVPPWWRADCRAGEKGAASFRQFSETYIKLWQYERDTHDGPVFGEGNNHWYWSGALDGVEAQFGSGWASGQGTSAPLAVDFDLVKIHPLQFNHGMGYYERWSEAIDYGDVPPMAVLDHYRMQEIAYGHAGFLGSTTWNLLPLAWLEDHLLTPVTSRCASARAVDISYLVGGKWVDATAAAKANVWDRVRVRYDNGLQITANGGSTTVRVSGIVLTQYGWLARGAGVTAYTALRDGVVVDYAETDDTVFANARRASDWDYAKVWNILPSILAHGSGGFRQTGPRKFRLTYEWQVGEKPPEGYTCFVHFIGLDTKGDPDAICFQDDHKIPESVWKPGRTVAVGPRDVEIPAGVADGDYQCYVGLYRPDHARLPIIGSDSRYRRVLVGTVHVSDSGKSITFDSQSPSDSVPPSLNLEHLNVDARIVDFGAVRTNGSVLIRREGSDWVLTPMPRDKPFVVEIKASRFGKPLGVQLDRGWWRLEMKGEREYRWRAK